MHIALVGLAMLACIIGGCAPSSAPSGGQPGEPTPSVSAQEATSETADDFTIDVPSGWVRVGTPSGPFSLALARDDHDTGAGYGLTVRRSSPEELRRTRWGPAPGPVVIDVHEFRDAAARDARETEGVSEVTVLTDREIGDAVASGMSVVGIDGDVLATWQEWFVWRHDGLWEIVVSPGGQAGEVPVELSDALDTVRWTTPGGAQS